MTRMSVINKNASHLKNKETEADRVKLLAVLKTYRDIFSPTLRGTQASVTPMEVHVDYDA